MPFKSRPSMQGKVIPDDVRKKISTSLKGINTWSKGKKLSKIHIAKLIAINANRKRNLKGQFK